MSVNFNAGLFMQNYHMQGNAVQKAPAASLSTPLAADKTGLSFNRTENQVGFGNAAVVAALTVKPGENVAQKIIKELPKAVDGTIDNDTLLILFNEALARGELNPRYLQQMRQMLSEKEIVLNKIIDHFERTLTKV